VQAAEIHEQETLPAIYPSIHIVKATTMSTSLDASPAWKALAVHYESIKDVTMKDMFAVDPERFNKFHLEFEDMLFDFSKNRINEETMKLLYALAAQQDVHGLAKKMYSGEKISEFLILSLKQKRTRWTFLHVDFRTDADLFKFYLQTLLRIVQSCISH
jgi:hypothetical protein